jgi:predicted ATPase
VTVLATSREALRVGGEAIYRVPPLEVPRESTADALAHGAVQLLFDRMRALGAAPQPSEMKLAAAAEVCRRLDGIPLAIEFAATHAAVLGLPQVAAHSADRLDLLGGGRSTALPRQQTLRATFDWSYDLLSHTEQAVLRCLGVFVGSFTLNAATAVASGIGVTPVAILQCVANLVEKSLVSSGDENGGRRFWLLNTIRSYLSTKLTEAGERTTTERHHAEYYKDLFSSVADKSGQSDFATDDPYATYAAEIDNVRAALDWALFSGGDAATGIALAAALTPLWVRMSLMAEATHYVRQALRLLEEAGFPIRELTWC